MRTRNEQQAMLTQISTTSTSTTTTYMAAHLSVDNDCVLALNEFWIAAARAVEDDVWRHRHIVLLQHPLEAGQGAGGRRGRGATVVRMKRAEGNRRDMHTDTQTHRHTDTRTDTHRGLTCKLRACQGGGVAWQAR